MFNIKEKNIRSIIIGEVCRGDKRTLEILHKDTKFHWSSVIISRTLETPLHIAAQYGQQELIHYLLEEFSPKLVDIRNIDNKTPLHVAAQFGRFDCVKILIENGAEVNAIKRSDWTPLMLACTKPDQCYKEIVEYLLDQGSVLNFKNKDGWTCLHLASRNNNSSILKAILKTNIDLNSVTKNGRTGLHISALHGNLQNVELLISKIDVNSQDFSGNTPLHEAIFSGNIELLDFLISKGADISARNKTGSNILHLAAANGSNDLLKHIVTKYTLNLNNIDLNGYTCLHYAAKRSHTDTYNLLVELGINTQILDNSGKSAHAYLT